MIRNPRWFPAVSSRVFTLACLCAAVVLPRAGQAQQPHRRALIVGVKDYAYNSWNNLKHPDMDARDLARALTDPNVGAWATEDVVMLTNEQATRSNFESQLMQMLNASAAGDYLVVCYSGHGFTAKGETYLAMHDTDPQQPDTTAIDLSILKLWMSWSGSQASKVLLLDACRPGTATVGVQGGSQVLAGVQNAFGGTAAGMGYITTSGPGELSHEGAYNSRFTEALLEGMRGKAPGRTQHVTLAELWSYVTGNLTGQTPQQGGMLPMDLPIAVRPVRTVRQAQPSAPETGYLAVVSLNKKGERKKGYPISKTKITLDSMVIADKHSWQGKGRKTKRRSAGVLVSGVPSGMHSLRMAFQVPMGGNPKKQFDINIRSGQVLLFWIDLTAFSGMKVRGQQYLTWEEWKERYQDNPMYADRLVSLDVGSR